MRCMERTRVDYCFESKEIHELVKWVNESTSIEYNLELVGDSLAVYKKGVKFITDIKDNKKHVVCCKLSSPPKGYAKKDTIPLRTFLDNKEYFISSQDSRFESSNQDIEKEFQYRLAKKLTVGVDTSMIAISALLEYSQKHKGFRVDLVVVNFPESGERPFFTLVEIKRGPGSVGGEHGIKTHLEDYTDIISNHVIHRTLVNDSELVLIQKTELGIIPNIRPNDIAKSLDIDISKTNILFVLADVQTDSDVLAKECGRITWEKYYNCPIEFAFVDSSDCDYKNYKRESVREFSKRWTTQD